MSDLQPQDVNAAAEPARREESAGEPERPFHSRRLLSLSAQRRRPPATAQERPAADETAWARTDTSGRYGDEPRDRRGERGNGRSGASSAGASSADAMAAALAALSGIDDRAREQAQLASAEAVRESAAANGATEADGATEAGGEEAGLAALGEPQVRRLVDAQPPRSEPRRPTRPLYTLQEVHELTGIPYATLALYAARDAGRVPWLGERRSPAYARAGLEEFCRIHAEANPGWQPPELGLERGWDDERGLAARLDLLASVQERLCGELHEVLAEVRRGWRGEAVWVD